MAIFVKKMTDIFFGAGQSSAIFLAWRNLGRISKGTPEDFSIFYLGKPKSSHRPNIPKC